MQNMDWLDEELGGYEDDYLIIDCPGMSPLFLAGSPAEGRTRADRVVHSSSISPNVGEAFEPVGPSNMCALPRRVAIHGGQVQVLQVRSTFQRE
jgi:hypothetical protein